MGSLIKQSLERLYSRNGATKHFPDESVTRARRGMHELVKGQYVNTPFGDIFVAQVRHPREHDHGAIPLSATTTIADDWLSKWGRFSSSRKFNHRKTVYVDTETSGLAGGGGTIPFLIGIGYFLRGQFRIEQFFVDSHSREEGMLDLVADFVQPFDTVVTYNGKAFDMPLIETRYVLKRKQSPFSHMEHLDLLHPSRQLWNLTLDNCRLQTIEQQLLGFRRPDDLPGEEIPQAYFNYIRWGEPDPLYRVFQHNADDITSLAVVTYLLWRGVQDDRIRRDAKLDFSRGRILNRYGERDRAISSLESARRKETSVQRKASISGQLSMIYKVLGQWDNAESIWMEMINPSAPFRLLPYEELAKYYEHRTKDLARAKRIVGGALARIPAHRSRDTDDLHYRLNRLDRRIERMKDRADVKLRKPAGKPS